MLLTIKMVDKCDKDIKGEFKIKSQGRCEIVLSKKYNKELGDFAETLLHELLHLWVTILQSHGVKEGIRLEHRFINQIVPYTLKKFVKMYK